MFNHITAQPSDAGRGIVLRTGFRSRRMRMSPRVESIAMVTTAVLLEMGRSPSSDTASGPLVAETRTGGTRPPSVSEVRSALRRAHPFSRTPRVRPSSRGMSLEVSDILSLSDGRSLGRSFRDFTFGRFESFWGCFRRLEGLFGRPSDPSRGRFLLSLCDFLDFSRESSDALYFLPL